MAVGELAEIFEYLSYSENRAPFMARDSIPRVFVYYAGHKAPGIDSHFTARGNLDLLRTDLNAISLGPSAFGGISCS